jgi:alcohol dehydrogenase class IV
MTAPSTAFAVSQFTARTRVVSGLGSIDLLAGELARLGVERVAVVADAGVAQAGLLDQVVADVPGIAWTGTVEINPDAAACEDAATAARAAGCDGVLAVGGGSALGLGKAVAIRLANDGSILDFQGEGRVPLPPYPLVAVPTTAGSGSEVSNALVLHEPGRVREIIVRGAGCEPDVAVLDGRVLRDLPREPMLYAALDALSHACEALWAVRRSVLSDGLAEKAIRTIIEILPVALDARDDAALQRMLEASTAANLACGNTGLGLIHALSSAPAVRLPHGYQNGAMLLAVADFNAPVLDPEHRKLIAGLPDLFERVAWPGRFADGDLNCAAIRAMVSASTGHPFRTNNARPSTDRQLHQVLVASGPAPASNARGVGS